MNEETLINELAEELIEIWYAAEDYGEDNFTEVMLSEEVMNHKKMANKIFEASCWYTIQSLIFSSDNEILERIVKAKGFELKPITQNLEPQ